MARRRHSRRPRPRLEPLTPDEREALELGEDDVVLGAAAEEDGDGGPKT